ncbi:MAG: hypothetical protein FD131_1282 [Rhodocyclaceae bacterium]|nr:MAG: hypothetical protein FD131_1282 [Rhodocyclaceae bacterium]
MNKIRVLATAIGLALSLPGFAATTTLSFQEGVGSYTGTQDTMIRSNETAMGSGQTSNGDSRGLAFGTLDYVSVDGDDGSPGNKPNQGLLRFENLFGNVAGRIASTDTIVSAKLTLEVFNPGSGMSVYNMLTGWSESSTWNSLVSGVQTNGTDASATAVATFGANNGSENIANGKLVIDVTSSLLAWQAGATNYGWVMTPFASGTNGIDFYASEFATANLRPLLSVEVMPVPEPESYAMLLAGLGLIGAVARRKSA